MTSDGCENALDNAGGLSLNCSMQLENGWSCIELKKSKYCDRACNLCACSTGSGTIREHCSGHGTCRALCEQTTCIDNQIVNAGCECNSGWSGNVCQNRKLIIAYVSNLKIIGKSKTIKFSFCIV